MSRTHAGAAMAAIVLIAAALRLYALGNVPFGFHPDEGHNALDALAIAEGWRPVFLPGNNGREPLFMSLMAALLSVFGPSIAAARSAAAVSGIAVVTAMYPMARDLAHASGPRTAAGARLVAVAAAGWLAVTFWPVAQARYALRAALLPLWVTLLVWSWWQVVRTPIAPSKSPHLVVRAVGWGSICGLFIAAAIYTHLTGRILLLIPLLSGLATVALRWRAAKDGRPVPISGAAPEQPLVDRPTSWGSRVAIVAPLIGVLSAAAVAAALAIPQWRYFMSNPDMATYRADQVSLLNPEVNEGDLIGAVVENAIALAASPFIAGDGSWYHNISGRPIFGVIGAIAFAVGLAVVLGDLVGANLPSYPKRRRLSARSDPANRSPAGVTTAAPAARSRSESPPSELERQSSTPSPPPALRRLNAQLAAIVVLTVLAVGAAPSLLSVGAPNYVRLTAVWPALFYLAGVGLVTLAEVVVGVATPRRRRRSADENESAIVKHALVALAIVGAAAVTARDYFGRYATAPEVYDSFNGAAVERGYQIRNLSDSASQLYVTPVIWKQSVIRFLNYTTPPRVVSPESGLVLPPSGDALYAFDPVEAETAAATGARWPMLARTELLRSGAVRPPTELSGRASAGTHGLATSVDAQETADPLSLILFELKRDRWPAIDLTPAAAAAGEAASGGSLPVFGDAMRLTGYGVASAPQPPDEPGTTDDNVISIVLAFDVLAPTATDRNLFVHLTNASGEAVGQYDGPPFDGTYTTDEWQPGESVLFEVPVAIADTAADLSARIGWYDWRDGTRLAVPGSSDDSVTLDLSLAPGEGE